jgi:hypothetical protein
MGLGSGKVIKSGLTSDSTFCVKSHVKNFMFCSLFISPLVSRAKVSTSQFIALSIIWPFEPVWIPPKRCLMLDAEWEDLCVILLTSPERILRE